MQKLENINSALKFMSVNRMKLVNIGAPDVQKGTQTLMLGLMWTIVLRYQIAGRFCFVSCSPLFRAVRVWNLCVFKP
jgi:hypothetical protein